MKLYEKNFKLCEKEIFKLCERNNFKLCERQNFKLCEKKLLSHVREKNFQVVILRF